MIHGRNLILAIGGVPIAGSKGCSVDRDTDTIEVCSPTDGAAKTYIPGTTGWSASANGLYATTEKANILRNIWRQRTPVQIQYTTGNQVEHGTAILTSLQESGEVGGLMKFSIKLQGSGVLGRCMDIGEWEDWAEDVWMEANGDTISLIDPLYICHVSIAEVDVWDCKTMRIVNDDQVLYVVCKGKKSDFDGVKTLDATALNGENRVVMSSDKTKDVELETGKYCVLANVFESVVTFRETKKPTVVAVS